MNHLLWGNFCRNFIRHLHFWLNHAEGQILSAGHAISLDSNPENRFSVRLFFTAIASAFRCPTSTTSFLPRVIPV